jgi:hemolysin activation/secretion protein
VKGSVLRFAAAWAACLVSVSTTAAPVTVVPPAPTPGQVQSTLPTKAVAPKTSAPVVGSGPYANPAGVAPGGTAVKVARFDITGNSVIPEAELQAQVASYIGQSLTLAELYEVADVLTRYYRAKGYGLAYVSLPAQTLSGGAIRLEVLEGRVSSVNVQGNTRTRDTVFKKRAAAVHVGEVYRNDEAEQAVLLMNDLPGVQARAVLSPGSTYGTSDLLFNVDEQAASGDFSVDDYGRKAIGRWRVNADLTINSLTGRGDQLGAGITHSEGNLLNFGKLSYGLPVGMDGTLTAGLNRAEYHVLGPFPASGSTENSSLVYQFPSLRTRAESFYWGFGVTHNTSKLSTSTAGDPTNITLLQITTFMNKVFEDQSYYTLSTSFNTNGKSNDGSKNDAEKARLEMDFSGVKPLNDYWSFIGLGGLYYSPDPLVDTDEFSFGGPGSVRGFQSAEARGDRALSASAELQRQFPVSPTYSLAWGFFGDSAKIWAKSRVLVAGGTATPSASNTLTSLGTELLLNPVARGWNLRLQAAWAVGGYRPSDDTPGALMHKADRGPHLWLTFGTSY